MSYHPQSPSRDINNNNKKRKRISHESEELAWTAARCSRLLRSITSRIVAIRKLSDSNAPAEVGKPKKNVARKVAGHWSTQDPVWMGDAKRKTATKTFAGRRKIARPEAPREPLKSAAINFPSPFVRRIGLGGVPSPAVPFNRPAPPPPRQTRQLPIKPGSPLEEAERGLSSAFSSALIATDGPDVSPCGARSLMSTCLRKVPHYIALLEEDENDEDIDSASEVVSYLENLGTKEKGGWNGLREVVRSQALYSVCEAIEDGMLCENLIRQLVEHCRSQGSTHEGFELLIAWLGGGETVTAQQIRMLTSFGRDQNCMASTFRLMQSVGEQNFTRLEIFCKTPGFWNEMLRSLSRASPLDAEAYLSTCLSYCLKSGANCSPIVALGLQEIIIKLTSMAGSALLLGNTQTDRGSLHQIVYRLMAGSFFPNPEAHTRELHHLLAGCSLFLLGVSEDSYGSLNIFDLSSLVLQISTLRSQRSNFADEIISSMAALERHLHSDLTGLLLDRMVEQASAAPLYRDIALAAITAKQHSSESDDGDANLYADYINRLSMDASTPAPKIPRTPFRKHAKAQYRWEEGICEWVAKTPFTAATATLPKPSSIPVVIPKFDDKENCFPFEETSSMFHKKKACLPLNSPDVLALSPQKRKLAESPLRPQLAKRKRLSNQESKSQRSDGRRRTSRKSDRSCTTEDSADELGF